MSQRENQWSFERPAEGWIWRHHNRKTGADVTSQQPFLTLLQCIDDAKRHGYDPDLSRHAADSRG